MGVSPTTKEARRLREIRMALGYTQAEMAEIVGLSFQTLRNFEHGYLQSPPPDEVMALAERMLAESQGVAASKQQAGTPRRVDVRDWCKRLGLPPGDYVGLAAHLGLPRSTPYRWLRRGVPPRTPRIHLAKVEAVKAKIDNAPAACRKLGAARMKAGLGIADFAGRLSGWGETAASIAAIERGEQMPAPELLVEAERIARHKE